MKFLEIFFIRILPTTAFALSAIFGACKSDNSTPPESTLRNASPTESTLQTAASSSESTSTKVPEVTSALKSIKKYNLSRLLEPQTPFKLIDTDNRYVQFFKVADCVKDKPCQLEERKEYPIDITVKMREFIEHQKKFKSFLQR